VAVYFASEQLLRDDPDLAKRFTEAMNESLAYADAHPDEARQVLTTYTQIEEAVIGDLTLPKWPSEINRESVHLYEQIQQAKRGGEPSPPASPEGLAASPGG
jgi:NitT/TauT family transport system substrate-binding protein